MPGNLQTENIVSGPPPTIVVSLTTTAPTFSLSLSLSDLVYKACELMGFLPRLPSRPLRSKRTVQPFLERVLFVLTT
jgi:hypothetical protein